MSQRPLPTGRRARPTEVRAAGRLLARQRVSAAGPADVHRPLLPLRRAGQGDPGGAAGGAGGPGVRAAAHRYGGGELRGAY